MKKIPVTVKVSPEYKIEIPPTVRNEAGIEPGMEFEVLVTERGIRLIPLRSLTELRGLIRRDDTVPVREEGEFF